MSDHPQARQFLRRLDPEAAAFTFQTFDDTKEKRTKLARVMHGVLDEQIVATLGALQKQRAGVFVTVNATDGKGRQAHNVLRVRAVFVDLDGAPLQPVLDSGLDPQIVVESSPGKYHAYWLTDDCELDQFERVQKALAQRFGGDTSVTDLSRVMRVPGFSHFKDGAQHSKLLEGVGSPSVPPYPIAEIIRTLKLKLDAPEIKRAPNGAAGMIEQGQRHSHLFALGRSMARRSTREAVHAALTTENATRCDPPLPAIDIDNLAKRAFDAKHAAGWQEKTPDTCANVLLKTDSGVIIACDHNAHVLIAAAPAYSGLHFDNFLSRPRMHERDWTDADELTALCWLQATHNPRFNMSHARNGARAVSFARQCDSLRAFVEQLPAWDRIPRIALAFSDAWGAPESPLIRASSCNFFIALIARALHPGAQVDTLWTFEGPQGSFKSRALRELGGSFHAEISAALGTIDFQRELRGIWLAEMSELDSLRGREASTVKRLLSAPSDRFVQKYALHAQSYPRRAVAVATTNEATYWQDATGARRLIPIPCTEIRVDLIPDNRLQWFAEARALYEDGHAWWEFPGIEGAQSARQHVDAWEDTLRDYITNGKPGYGGANLLWPDGPILSAVIMRDWLRLEPSQQGQASSTRLGRVMRRIGFAPVRIGHEQDRGWQRADT